MRSSIPVPLQQATLTQISGAVELIRNGQAIEMQQGMPLLPGDRLQTGENGHVEVAFSGIENHMVIEHGSAATLGLQVTSTEAAPQWIATNLTGTHVYFEDPNATTQQHDQAASHSLFGLFGSSGSEGHGGWGSLLAAGGAAAALGSIGAGNSSASTTFTAAQASESSNTSPSMPATSDNTGGGNPGGPSDGSGSSSNPPSSASPIDQHAVLNTLGNTSHDLLAVVQGSATSIGSMPSATQGSESHLSPIQIGTIHL